MPPVGLSTDNGHRFAFSLNVWTQISSQSPSVPSTHFKRFLNGAANLKAKAEDKLFTHIIIVPFFEKLRANTPKISPCPDTRVHSAMSTPNCEIHKETRGQKTRSEACLPTHRHCSLSKLWDDCRYMIWSIALPVKPLWLRHVPWKKTDEVLLLSLPLSTIQYALLIVKLSMSVKPSSYPTRNLEKLLSQQSERKKATVWITIILSVEV